MERCGPAVFQGRGWGVFSAGGMVSTEEGRSAGRFALISQAGAPGIIRAWFRLRDITVFSTANNIIKTIGLSRGEVWACFSTRAFSFLECSALRKGSGFQCNRFFDFFGGGGGFGASTRGVFTGIGGMDGRGFRCVLIIARWFKREYFAACGAARVLRCICAAKCLPA